MTKKEYTGPEFEIEFARAWLKYVEAGKVGVDPESNWERRDSIDRHVCWQSLNCMPTRYTPEMIYRWKPIAKRTVWISYYDSKVANYVRKELVAPEVEAPAIGTPIYLLDKKPEVEWEDRPWLVSWLKAGLVFLTREDAQAMSDWIAVCRKGGQS